jgi:hypothetical protein
MIREIKTMVPTISDSVGIPSIRAKRAMIAVIERYGKRGVLNSD